VQLAGYEGSVTLTHARESCYIEVQGTTAVFISEFEEQISYLFIYLSFI
jgi:hypothetical protein